jgi:hypothetical protein
MRDQAAIFLEAEKLEKVRKTISLQHRDERSSCKESSKLRNLSQICVPAVYIDIFSSQKILLA